MTKSVFIIITDCNTRLAPGDRTCGLKVHLPSASPLLLARLPPHLLIVEGALVLVRVAVRRAEDVLAPAKREAS